MSQRKCNSFGIQLKFDIIPFELRFYRLNDGWDVMKLETSISSELFIKVESLAKRLGVSRSELLRRALEAYLRPREDEAAGDSIDSEKICQALDEIYSESDSEVDEVLSSIQWASLPKGSW